MGRFSDLVKHGHTHRPGATDPIPGLSLDPVFSVVEAHAWHADVWPDTIHVGSSGSWSLVNDATAPGGYYYTSVGTTAYREFRLWVPADTNTDVSVVVGFGRGTDCGIFKIRVAREYSGGVSSYHDNWQGTVNCDTYFASSDWKTQNFLSGDFCAIRPRYTDPADGDLVSGGWVTESFVTYWNGGPGWYRIRVQNVGTKNASSSDYRLKLFVIKRAGSAPSHTTLGD